MVAAQEKVQKLPKEEEGSPAQIRIPQTLSRGEWPGRMRQPWSSRISPVTAPSMYLQPLIQAGYVLRAAAGSPVAFSKGEIFMLCTWEQAQILCSKPGLRMEPGARLLGWLLISFSEAAPNRQPHQQLLTLPKHTKLAGGCSLRAKQQPAQSFCCPFSCQHHRSAGTSPFHELCSSWAGHWLEGVPGSHPSFAPSGEHIQAHHAKSMLESLPTLTPAHQSLTAGCKQGAWVGFLGGCSGRNSGPQFMMGWKYLSVILIHHPKPRKGGTSAPSPCHLFLYTFLLGTLLVPTRIWRVWLPCRKGCSLWHLHSCVTFSRMSSSKLSSKLTKDSFNRLGRWHWVGADIWRRSSTFKTQVILHSSYASSHIQQNRTKLCSNMVLRLGTVQAGFTCMVEAEKDFGGSSPSGRSFSRAESHILLQIFSNLLPWSSRRFF